MKKSEKSKASEIQGAASRILQSSRAAVIFNEQQLTSDALQVPTLPKTPQRATPNSSRKVLRTPNLFRSTPSPSHCAKMATLFQDAASSLHFSMASGRNSPSNMKKPRIPPSQRRFTKFGRASCETAVFALGNACGRTPDENGSPSNQCQQSLTTVNCPPTYGCPTMPLMPNVMTSRGIVSHPPTRFSSPKKLHPVRNAAAREESNSFSDNFQTCEPISSGFVTPAHSRIAYPETPTAFLKPDAGPWRVPRASSLTDPLDSDDEEHSTHGVRLVLPYTCNQAEAAQQANIDAWLEQVLQDGVEVLDPNDQPCHGETELNAAEEDVILPGEVASEGLTSDSEIGSAYEHSSSYQRSSNKENIPPPLPPRRPPPPYKSSSPSLSSGHSPSLQTRALPRLPSSTRKLSHTLTPGVRLSAPPRRKKPRVNEDSNVPLSSQRPADHTVRADELAAALATLSPSVETHRRGRGPKRERCASFWDADILEPGSPAYPTQRQAAATRSGDAKVLRNGKQVLGEGPPNGEIV